MQSDSPKKEAAVKTPVVKKAISVPLLAGTAIVLAIVWAAAYYWHSVQVARSGDVVRAQAEALAEENEWRRAAEYMYWYTRMRPDDAQARVRLAEMWDRAATHPMQKGRAIGLYYEALGASPGEKETAIRCRLAELLFEAGRYTGAIEEATKVPQGDADRPKAQRLLALALYGQSQSRGQESAPPAAGVVGEALERALKLNPGDVQLAYSLAVAYRSQEGLLSKEQLKQAPDQQKRKEAADQLIEAMVRLNPSNPAALLADFQYREEYRLPGSAESLQAALKLGKDDVAVLVAAGDYARRQARLVRQQGGSAEDAGKLLDEAARHFRRITEVAPASEMGFLRLADLLLARSQPKQAVEVLRQGAEGVGTPSVVFHAMLAESLLRQGELDEVAKLFPALESGLARLDPNVPPPARRALQNLVKSAHARWLVAKRDYAGAIPELRQLAAARGSSPAEEPARLEALGMLGNAYAAVRQWDQAALCYEQLATEQPQSIQSRLAAAMAWSSAGRADAAVAHLRQAVALDKDGAPEPWLALARAELDAQLRLPKAERQWASFRKALAEAKKARPGKPLAQPWVARLLEADYLVAEGEQQGKREEKVREAAELLRKSEKEFASFSDSLKGLVPAYEALGLPADADRVLGRLEATGATPDEVCLLRAGLLLHRNEREKARALLEARLKVAPAAVPSALERQLVAILFQGGQVKEATDRLIALQKREPKNTDLLCLLADLALEEGNLDQAKTWEGELRALERADDGPLSQYYEARRLLAQASGPQDPGFLRALDLQAKLQSTRPAWPSTHVLRGMILELQGRPEEAAEAYQNAIRLGERRVWCYQRLAAALVRAGQYAKADEYLARLGDQVQKDQRLSVLELSVAVQRGQMDRALDLARRAVQQRPTDAMAQLRLSEVLLAKQDNEAAERCLKEAVRLAPADPRAYRLLFAFYVRLKRPEQARPVMEEFSSKAKVSPAEKALSLAQFHEMLGDRKNAAAQYRESMRLAPENPLVQARLAEFFLQGDPGEAEREITAALQLAPNSNPLRRSLAAVLASRGGQQGWEQAQGLLHQADGNASQKAVDERLEAMLLSRRGGAENVAKSRQILEGLVADPERAAPIDRLLLAGVLEAEGKVVETRQQYLALLGRPNPIPAYMAAYLEWLLRRIPRAEPAQKRILQNDAADWMKRLEQAAPDALGTTALKARWLHAEGRTAEVDTVVESAASKAEKTLAGDVGRVPGLALAIGNLYSELALHKNAERWYGRLRDLTPQQYEPLAICLARQGRAREGIELCLARVKADAASVQPILSLASVLLQTSPSSDDRRLAEPTLDEALVKWKDNPDVLFQVASVRIMQQRLADGEKLLRQVLALSPKSVLALNNLATLLGERAASVQEARELIDRALEIAGPQPVLLDTKGMILVQDGKPKEAVPLLEAAASGPYPDPRYNFHLAAAYARLGDTAKAKDAFGKVDRAELKKQVLTPNDQTYLKELEAKLR